MRSVLAAVAASLLLLSLPLSAGELDTALRVIPGTQSAFLQRFTPKGFTKEQVERGTVTFGTLPQMRWSYSGSEARVFVFDGSTSWLYTPAEKQVQVSRLSAQQQAALPFAFLWSSAAKRQYSSSESRKGSDVIVKLTPSVPTAELKSVELRIAAATHAIKRVEYLDRNGNRTIFEFNGTRAVKPAAETFRFSAPAGVEVIEN